MVSRRSPANVDELIPNINSHATLILEADLSVTSEEELLTQIDEDVVSSYLPSFDRNDFLVTVFRGEEISSYTDSQSIEDDDE